MRRSELMTPCAQKTMHTIAPASTIAARPDPQHGVTIGAVSGEPRPIIEHGTTLFKRNTVQETGCGTS